jgi:hypothetical protein
MSYYLWSLPRRKSLPGKGLGVVKYVYKSRSRFCRPTAEGRRKPVSGKGLGILVYHRAAGQENGPRRKFCADLNQAILTTSSSSATMRQELATVSLFDDF